MGFFCILWVPLFYFLRRSFSGAGSSGGVFALLFGSITAITQFFLGYLVSPGGFGFSRWLFGFVDIVSLPVLLPVFMYFFLMLFRGLSGESDFANFALLWLMPVGALRAIGWGATSDVILLIAVPMLWTSLAVGISFFINLIVNNHGAFIKLVFILCIFILPAAAATSYWAFFSQQTLLGFVFFFVSHIPVGFSFVMERA